jgi:small subunit ribosomal protein S4e
VKKGGDTRLKRQLAPTFWNIRRKKGQFVSKPSCGPHGKKKSYPLGMILRDVLKLGMNMHEAKKILTEGKVKIDGIIRRESKFPVGLMDVIELIPTGQCYRFVPRNSKMLDALTIQTNEKMLKLVKVTSKVTIKQGRMQYGFHDGKTMIYGVPLSVGDTCLLNLQDRAIKDVLRFQKGNLALITSGENAGSLGRIEDIKDGIFSLPKRVILSLENRSVELPTDIALVVGLQGPIIKVN